MKKFFLFILIVESTFAFAQFTPPDYKKIKKNITNNQSNLFYPKLMERYLQGDTSLTDNECHHLYYGFTLQPEYQPYNNNDTELYQFLKEKPELNDEECLEAIRLSKEVLKENPFKFKALNTLMYCYDLLDSMELVNKCQWQMRAMAIAIIQSGNGLEPKTAFHVNEVGHEYFLLTLYELFPDGQELITLQKRHYDVLKLDENDYKIEKLYFNIDAFYNK